MTVTNGTQARILDHTGTTEGIVYDKPTVEVDRFTPPEGYVDIVIHEHGPDHGNFGIDILGTLRLTNIQVASLAHSLATAMLQNPEGAGLIADYTMSFYMAQTKQQAETPSGLDFPELTEVEINAIEAMVNSYIVK